MKTKALSMHGGEGTGMVPLLQRQWSVTEGQEGATPAQALQKPEGAPSRPHPSSPRLFKKQDLRCKMNKGEKSSQDLQAIIRVPTLLTARSSREFSARVPPSCPWGGSRVLQGAGSWAGGSDSVGRERVTEPAEWASSRSPKTGPHCYCFCGEPWSRTRRVRRATPAPGRWGR